MRRSAALTALFAAFLELGSAVAGGAANTVIVSERNAGQTVRVPLGRTLEVRLASGSGTGFSWSIARNDARLLVPAGAGVVAPASTAAGHPLLGGPGVAWLRFRALRAGKDTLRLEYRRPWIHGGPPARAFALVVIIGV
jgi:predicted secreted protein